MLTVGLMILETFPNLNNFMILLPPLKKTNIIIVIVTLFFVLIHRSTVYTLTLPDVRN